MNALLSKENEKDLLALARKSIAGHLGISTDKYPQPENLDDEIFKQELGAFVTLHINGQLRGCIGYIIGFKPLVEAIPDLALAAAFQDPRFMPLQKGEYPLIDIEISILTVPQVIESIDEIEVGRDGLIVSLGGARGLLLPQVATEYGWGVETFLDHTCLKAGLSADSWRKERVQIEKFSAYVFGEKDE